MVGTDALKVAICSVVRCISAAPHCVRACFCCWRHHRRLGDDPPTPVRLVRMCARPRTHARRIDDNDMPQSACRPPACSDVAEHFRFLVPPSAPQAALPTKPDHAIANG